MDFWCNTPESWNTEPWGEKERERASGDVDSHILCQCLQLFGWHAFRVTFHLIDICISQWNLRSVIEYRQHFNHNDFSMSWALFISWNFTSESAQFDWKSRIKHSYLPFVSWNLIEISKISDWWNKQSMLIFLHLLGTFSHAEPNQ